MAARQRQDHRIPSSVVKKQQILDRCRGVCCHCGKEIKIGEDFTVEHVIPLSKGGTNEFENLVSLCETCNKDKGNDIVDADYYEHAPKHIYEVIKNRLDDYYESHDWLTRTNIFRTDRFTIPVTQTLQLRNGKVLEKKSSCEIRKINDEDVDSFFESFNKAYFPEGPKDETDGERPSSAPLSDIYQIRYKERPVLIFAYSLSVSPKARLWFKIFVSPECNWGPAARIILADCFNGLVDKFIESLDARGTKSSVECCVEALKVDKRGFDFVNALGGYFWRNGCAEVESPMGRDYDGVIAVTFIGESIKDVALNNEEGVLDGFSKETFDKQEKLYRSQLQRRVKQNS